MATRQELERQLVAAHRSGNVQAAQQAAYAIRQYDQNALSAQVPQVNAPPPIERVPQPTFGSRFEGFSRGMGRGITSQLQGIEQIVTQPVETTKALYGAAEAAIRNPSQALGELFAYGKRTVQQATSGPEGFGQVLGENMRLVPGGRRTPTQAELDVYHGTPHTLPPEEGAPLGRFRSEKIGTGEGAQAYGYGLYFAESPDVAQGYRDALSNNVTVNGAKLQTIPSDSPTAQAHNNVVTAMTQNKMTPQEAISHTVQYWNNAADEMASFLKTHPELADRIIEEVASRREVARVASLLKPESFYKEPGSLYKVDLPDAKIEQMLDWDKPLAEQPQLLDALRRSKNKTVQAVMAQIGDPSKPIISFGQDLGLEDGKGLMNRLSYALDGKPNSPKASALLQKLGVPGVKYLDAGSRDGGKGTRNFVVFPGEEQNLTVLERNGEKAPVVPKAVAPQYNFKKESERVRNLVNAENVNIEDYDPEVKKPNTTYAAPTSKDRFGYLQDFKLRREFDGDRAINVYVATDELAEDLPDPRFDPNDPPYMFSSYVDFEGETAPKGTGALTQMTLEALEVVKRDKGGKSGWISEGVRSAETDAKYERLIAAGVPFQRTDDGTYFLMPQDLQALDLNKVSETLNKKYGGKK